MASLTRPFSTSRSTDGIRALVEIAPPAGGGRVSIWSRLGNEKTSQFPEIVHALERVAARVRRRLIVDGEIVALDARGEPAGFQQLQGRIHLASAPAGASQGVAFIAFDILRDGDADLVELPLTERRAHLEKVLSKHTGPLVRLSDVAAGDGRAMFERAKQQGWEGLIGKRAASCYRVGKRSPEWVKLKLVMTQEFVVGGWTEPRGARSAFGALLLGVYDGNGALEVRRPHRRRLRREGAAPRRSVDEAARNPDLALPRTPAFQRASTLDSTGARGRGQVH